MLGLFSLPALYFAFNLPDLKKPPSRFLITSAEWPSSFNVLTFLSAFIVGGLLIISLGELIIKADPAISPLQAVPFAAFYLGFNRLCSILVGPLAGWLGDRFGFHKTFVLASAFLSVGLSLILMDLFIAGAIITFVFYNMQSAIAPGEASSGSRDATRAIVDNATWKDTGAACGTLLAGTILGSQLLTPAFFILTFTLVVFIIVHSRIHHKIVKAV